MQFLNLNFNNTNFDTICCKYVKIISMLIFVNSNEFEIFYISTVLRTKLDSLNFVSLSVKKNKE